jgi:hypothetical protein
MAGDLRSQLERKAKRLTTDLTTSDGEKATTYQQSRKRSRKESLTKNGTLLSRIQNLVCASDTEDKPNK